uniref:RING-type E3 ubiquitin transferase n=1 Tax=Macrostomum lignano TaxID=282301 RepID=A0A1I8IY95_9PLAT
IRHTVSCSECNRRSLASAGGSLSASSGGRSSVGAVGRSPHHQQQQQPVIQGIRWTCAECDNYSLCSACYHGDAHNLDHEFYRFDYNKSARVSVGKRRGCVKMDARGIFAGARVVRGPDWDWGRQDGGDGRPGRVLDIRGWENESGRSVANVRWDNGLSNVYRVRGSIRFRDFLVHLSPFYPSYSRYSTPIVGHKGKVDLKLLQAPASWGLYYRDHLPVLGERLDSVGGGCPYRVGERVRVARSEAQLRVMQEGHGGWNEKMSELVGQCGHVHRITERGDVRVQFDSGQAQRWTLNPDALERVASLRAGQLVRVLDDETELRRCLVDSWQDWHRSLAGSLVKVHSVHSDSSALVVTSENRTARLDPSVLVRLQQSAETAANNRMASHDIGAPLNVLVQKLIELTSSTDAGAASTSTAGGSSAGGSAASSSSLGACRSFLAEVSQGNLETVRQMLASRATPVDGSINGKTGLMVACHQGHLEVVKLLLSHKASVSAIDEERDTPLHYAAFGNQPAAIKLLAAAGAPMDAQNNTGCTALHVAVNKQHKDCVQALLQLGASPNCQDSYGDTALHDAIGRASTDILNLLVQHQQLKPHSRNKRGFEPLHQAALKGNAGAAAALLARFGPEDCGNRRKDDGFAPLHLAALNGHVSVARALLDAGCNAEIRNQRGQTPFLLAVCQAKLAVASLLADRGADVNAADEDQDRACHFAAMRSGPYSKLPEFRLHAAPILAPTVALLDWNSKAPMPAKLVLTAWMLQLGADLGAVNRKGQTAVSLLGNEPDIVTCLNLFHRKLSLERADADSLCQVCQDDLSSVTFEPCGHRISCDHCSAKMRLCLRCKQPIERKLRDQDLIPAVAAAAAAEAGTSGGRQQNNLFEMQEELQRLREKVANEECSICMDNPRTVAFLCGHQACTDCAQALVQCHMCRKPIQARIQLYK